MKYIVGIDQSTQGTKALLFDEKGRMLTRCDRPHRQIINDRGWVSHSPEEILNNTLSAVRGCIEKTNISKADIAAIGISNQRETSVLWDRMVLLKNSNHLLPLKRGSKIALFGAGAGKTVKGGTGSGDVNERETVTIREGLKNAGFEIATEDWLNDYEDAFARARKA